MLAWELLGEFSSQREPSGWRQSGVYLFLRLTPSLEYALRIYKLGFMGEFNKLVYENEELPQSTSLTAPWRREP